MFSRLCKIIIFFYIVSLILILESCPNDQMRNLVEIKVSDPVADIFVINSGAPTSSLTVTLNSIVTKEEDALEMHFKNAGDDWSGWESYSPSKTWSLPIGDGIKTVYAEYRDQGHHIVSMVNSIVLNTGAPAGEFYVWGSAVSGNQHLYVNSESVTLCMTISNVVSMRFTNDRGPPWSPWIPYSDTYGWTLSSGDGLKTIDAEFMTNAGTTTFSTRLVTLDTTAPSVASFLINNGDAAANNISAELTYNYTETNQVWAQYRNDEESWSSQEDPGNSPVTKSRSLRPATGDRTVYIKLNDIAGNTSSVYSDSIFLSTAAPGTPSPTVSAISYTSAPTWSWPEVIGAVYYRVQLDNTNPFGWSERINFLNYSPDSLTDGNHTLYVQAEDVAGNWSESGSATTTVDTEFNLNIDRTPFAGGTTSTNTTVTVNIPVNITATPAAGYNFSHWQIVTGTGVTFEVPTSVETIATLTEGDATIQAVFTPKTYTALLSKQGGSGGTDSVTVTFNDPMPAATAPTRPGYTFNGYFTGTDGIGIQFYDGNMNSVNNWTLVSGVWLYAKWTANNYIVTLNKQGGYGGSNSVTATYNLSMPAAAAPSRSGFTFGGYYSGTNGSGTQYYNSSMVSVRTWNIASNTTIYAKWNYIIYALRSTGPAGGIIYYENPTWVTDGWRYLEAAPSSTEWSNIQWGKYGTELGGTSIDLGTGVDNTQSIVIGLAGETGRAAQLCNSLSYNSFTDWFLPSREELREMISELFMNDLGAFTSSPSPGTPYWSSSETTTPNLYAYVIILYDTPDLDHDDHPKNSTYHVRAVRRF